MSNQIVIHGVAFSNYVRSVLICCEEKGLAYQLKEVRPHSSEVKALNPFGKIPVLEHEGVTLYETAAICRYIDRQFEGPSLSPQTAMALARMDQWISVANSYIDPAVIRRCVLEYVFPSGEAGQVNQEKINAALPDVARYLAIVDEALSSSPYLAGEQPSIADYILLPMLDYMENTPPGGSLMSQAPAVNQWLKGMRLRPACAKIIS